MEMGNRLALLRYVCFRSMIEVADKHEGSGNGNSCRNMKQLSATAAHIYVGPIPAERGENFSIVTGNFATRKD
jgi:hypothetical protein